MFDQAYEKFLKNMKEFDLVSEDTKKVIISTSGGKDANIMTELLYRYQQEYRKDLELVLVNAAIPKWKYMPEDFIQKLDDEEKIKALREEQVYIERHRTYWEERGIKTVYVEHVDGSSLLGGRSMRQFCHHQEPLLSGLGHSTLDPNS